MALCYVKAYYDWIEQTAALSDAERGRLFTAILEYGRTGLEPKLEGRESILFPVFKSQLDRDRKTSEVNAENGRRGGRPKSEENRNKAKITEPNPTKGNKDKDKEEDKDKDIILSSRDAAFERFWDAYPRKVGKAAAKTAFLKAKGVSVDSMIKAVEAQSRSDQWLRDNGQYIPHPATWLNQGRWDDVVGSATPVYEKTELPTSIRANHR